MSQSVLISIKPEWCEKIATGEKTLEVRKTRPKQGTPFKVYIYCTSGKPFLNKRNGRVYIPEKDILGGLGPGLYYRLNGTIIGEFVCDTIECVDIPYPAFQSQLDKKYIEKSCVTYYALHRYAYHNALYFWHISGLKIYDSPKTLDLFASGGSRLEIKDDTRHIGWSGMKYPPQSWCYAEEIK